MMRDTVATIGMLIIPMLVCIGVWIVATLAK